MEGGLILGGDGRSDSPGHCAKYGSYSMLETRINKVVDIQLVQSIEVGSSVNMEKEGLIRSVRLLQDHGLDLMAIVTDRHPQIQKWLREELSNTTHYYDVWHISKSVRKKLESLAKMKGNESLYEWIRSICNHLYWCASSSLDDSPEIKVGKWKSVVYHVQNQHTGHNETECYHAPLDETVIRKKKWLTPNTNTTEELERLVTNTLLCRDIKKLSPLAQTSSVEAFHSVINHFCPKMSSYSYRGMLTRLYLAALHYNYNSSRPQATNRKGEKIYVLKFPKYKKGGFIVSAKKEAPTYDYVQDLMTALFKEVLLNPENYQEMSQSIAVPPTLCSQIERPDKAQAVEQHTSRFSKI